VPLASGYHKAQLLDAYLALPERLLVQEVDIQLPIAVVAQ